MIPTMPSAGVPPRLLAFTLLTIGLAAVRLLLLDARGPWEDELYSYNIALGRADILALPERAAMEEPVRTSLRPYDPAPLSSVIACVKNSPYGPVLPLLLRASLLVVPAAADQILVLRVWNVLFAVLTLLVLHNLCRFARLPEPVPLVASFLWGLSAWDLAVSLQLRSYALGTLLTALSLAMCLRLAVKPSASGSVFLAMSLSAAVLTHYMLVTLLPLSLLCLLLSRRGPRALRFFGLAWGIAITAVAAWFIVLGATFWRTNQNVDSTPFLGIQGVPHLLEDPLKRAVLPLPFSSRAPVGSDIFVAFCFLGIVAWTMFWPRTHRLARTGAAIWYTAVAMNVVACFVYRTNGLIWPRYLVFYLPFFWIAVAAALSAPLSSGSRWMRAVGFTATAAALTIASLEAVAHSRALRDRQNLYPNEVDRVTDWREFGQHIVPLLSRDAVVVAVPGGFTLYGVQYYAPPGIRVMAADASTERCQSVIRESKGSPVVVVFTWGQARMAAHRWSVALRKAGYSARGSAIDRSGVALRFETGPLDPENLEVACELTELAYSFRPWHFTPGVRKFRSMEEANLHRSAWEREQALSGR